MLLAAVACVVWWRRRRNAQERANAGDGTGDKELAELLQGNRLAEPLLQTEADA